MSKFLSPQWLKDYYKNWTSDDLHDERRTMMIFGDNSGLQMVEAEIKRRKEAEDVA